MVRWAEHVTRVEAEGNIYKLFVENLVERDEIRLAEVWKR
jgi:hypothetical protein